MDWGFFFIYYMYLEKEENQKIFFFVVRKWKKSKIVNYFIIIDLVDLFCEGESYVGKFRFNFMGIKFIVYDCGICFIKGWGLVGVVYIWQELVVIFYEMNVFGFKGFRKMFVIIFGMILNYKQILYQL